MNSPDLDGLIGDLGKVTRVSPKAARIILQKTAEPAKQFWKGAAATGRKASAYASAITYNTYQLDDGAEGEIGADLGRKGGTFGLLDDPLSTGGIRSTPSRARRAASSFIAEEFDKWGRIVVDQTLRDADL